MHKTTKWLAAILIVCLLFHATGTLAAGEARGEASIKQVSRNIAIYAECSKKADRLGYVACGMVLFVLDLTNGFSAVQVGTIKGVVETKYLISPNESASVIGPASIKNDTRLVAPPDVSIIAQLKTGQTVYVLSFDTDLAIVKANGKIGFVFADNLIPYDEKSPVIEWVIVLKQTDIKNGEGKKAARLARAKKGSWIEVLQMLDDDKAIVRYENIVGVMSLKNTKPIDSSGEFLPEDPQDTKRAQNFEKSSSGTIWRD
ncbi:MAG: hypothetical protein AAGU74_11545 [Bacillota bacterium]